MDASEKNAYQKKMEAELDRIKAELRRMEAELRTKSADEELKSSQRLDELRARRERVKEKLQDLRNASESAWDQARDGVANAWTELETAFEAARNEFRK